MLQRVYLIGSIILFILLLIPYFENISSAGLIVFGGNVGFHTVFRLLLTGGMVLGCFITILVQGFIQGVKDNTDKNKFDM